MLAKVALAMLLGALIGLERELADKPAGLRTNMLVAGAAALLVALGDTMVDRFAMRTTPDLLRSDPIRIIEAIITGICFLGAGTLIVRRDREGQIEGLTTAASILFVAAIGVAVALVQIVLAVGVTVLVLITLRGMRVVDRWIGGRLAENESRSRPQRDGSRTE